MRTKFILITIAVAIISFLSGMGFMKYHLFEEISDIKPEIQEHTCELNGWQLLQMAIIMEESNFDSTVVSKNGNYYGLYQISKPYIAELNHCIGYEKYKIEDALSADKSIEMFNEMQYYKNNEHDVEMALYLHNPKGVNSNYGDRVLKNFRNLIKQEEIRSKIKNY